MMVRTIKASPMKLCTVIVPLKIWQNVGDYRRERSSAVVSKYVI